MSEITPIETRYNGCLFRSRTEARWAVFFDAIGLPWHFEPQPYRLKAFSYLPDFFLPTLNMLVEIKPIVYTRDGQLVPPSDPKAGEYQYLSRESGYPPLLILCGIPGLSVPGAKHRPYEGFAHEDDYYYWCRCPRCGASGIQWMGRAERNQHSEGCTGQQCKNLPGWNDPLLIAAFEAARSARFERSETPKYRYSA